MSEVFFHLHMKNISRRGRDGKVRSVVAKAAYNAGENLWLAREDRTTTLRPRHDIFLRQLLVPEGAPDWASDRAQLWNKVDASAKRKDARLAKEMTAALVVGIPPEQWQDMVTEFASEYLALGQVVDVAIHEDGSLSNPHIHFLMTVNHLGADSFGKKITEVDLKRFLTDARTRWEAITNQYLKANGLEMRVDARSYKARGLSQQPTRHRGPNRAERNAWRQRALQNNKQFQEQTMPDKNRPTGNDYHELELENQPDTMPSDDPRTWIKQERGDVSVDRSALYGEQWDRALDVVEQVRHEPPTQQEEALREAVRGAPEALRFEVEKEILHQKAQRLAEKEQTARLDYIEQHLDADGLREFNAYMEDRERAPDYPQPERGPDGDLRASVELADARKRMIEEYERDDKRQR